MDFPEQPALQLHTTVFRVSNLERARRFYETAVGLNVVYEDLHYRLISLQLGGGSLLTLWEMRPEDLPSNAAAKNGSPTGIATMYMVFYCRDATAWRAELEGRGVSVEPIEEREIGLRLFWFTDPDGHRFCVIQFLPE